MLKSIAIAAVLCTGASAHSQELDFGKAAFLPGWTENDGSVIAAIRIDLNSGWKTYWRVPGAAGIPPEFNWIGSENLLRAEVMFPAPEVEYVGGLQSIGYHDHVVFPIRIVPVEIGQAVDVALEFTFGACEEICIPVEQRFSVRLDPNAKTANRSLIQSAIDNTPDSAKTAGVISAECSVRPDGKDFLLLANIQMRSLPDNLPVVVFEPDATDIWVDVAATRFAGGSIIAEAPLQYYGDGGIVLERSKIRLTLLGEAYAVDIQGCPA